MKTRRAFLKFLLGTGALFLPWTTLPERLFSTISKLLGKPDIKLELPSRAAGESLKWQEEVLARKALEDIKVLSHPDMEGRRACTAGETKALIYLEQQLGLMGLKAFGQDNFLQLFSVPPMEEKLINGRALFRPGDPNGLRLPSCNILAGLEGKKKEETVIISAHFDHLGIYNGRLCPGANDNASGVGCVLEVMRRLVKKKLKGTIPQRNIVASFWGAEEMGALGSKHFVQNPTIPLKHLKAVINLDTVGNGELKDFILWHNENTSIIEIVKRAGQKNGVRIQPVSRNGHYSDEISFSGTGVPAVTILSKDWLWKNHTPEDNIAIIKEDKLSLVCEILCDIVEQLAY